VQEAGGRGGEADADVIGHGVLALVGFVASFPFFEFLG